MDYDDKDFPVDNIVLFNERLSVAVANLNLVKKSLGKVFGHDIWLIHPKILRRPRLLFSAGFHGEEPAGVWGTLNFLEHVKPTLFDKVSVSFLPLVNPTGIATRRRYNAVGENPNNNFCHANPDDQPSLEGQILLANLPLLLSLAENSFVSLHEDRDCSEFYLYTFETEVSSFSKKLIDIESRFFPPLPDEKLPEQPLKDGLIFNFCDGSFEDRMHHEGIPYTACTETPGKDSLNKRVAANSAIIEGIIEHFCCEKVN